MSVGNIIITYGGHIGTVIRGNNDLAIAFEDRVIPIGDYTVDFRCMSNGKDWDIKEIYTCIWKRA